MEFKSPRPSWREKGIPLPPQARCPPPRWGNVTRLTTPRSLLPLLAALFATTGLPPAAAEGEVVWQGLVEYDLSRGGLRVITVSSGCDVQPAYNLTLAGGDFGSPEERPASSRANVTCAPSMPARLVQGKTPACSTTAHAVVKGVGVLVGHASCTRVSADCVASVALPCAAQAMENQSRMGACGTWLAAAVDAQVRVRCMVTIVWT